jgi:flavodoxin
MKVALVYYSLDGNCAFIAEELKTPLGADLIRLELKDDKKRRGFMKILWGGGMVFSKKNPPLKPYTFNPAPYELIVIGVPVWAGSPAPPILTFLSQAGIRGKKIALFVCHGGGKGNALDTLKKHLAGNEIIAEKDFVYPLKNSAKAKLQAAAWVKGNRK